MTLRTKDYDHVHDVIKEMFQILPEPGEDFSATKRVSFLQALTNIFNLLYKSDGQETVIVARRDGESQPGEKA